MQGGNIMHAVPSVIVPKTWHIGSRWTLGANTTTVVATVEAFL